MADNMRLDEIIDPEEYISPEGEDDLKIVSTKKHNSEQQRMLNMGFKLDKDGNYTSPEDIGTFKSVEDLQQSGKVMKEIDNPNRLTIFKLNNDPKGKKGIKTYATVISKEDKYGNHTAGWSNYITADGRWIVLYWQTSKQSGQKGIDLNRKYEVWVEVLGQKMHESKYVVKY
jgi:hypothetical protein